MYGLRDAARTRPRSPAWKAGLRAARQRRQSIRRYTRRFTLALRHRGVRPLIHCGATEELPDGSEVSTAQDIVWDHEGDDVVLTHTRDYLQPNQAVTVRWEVTH